MIFFLFGCAREDPPLIGQGPQIVNRICGGRIGWGQFFASKSGLGWDMKNALYKNYTYYLFSINLNPNIVFYIYIIGICFFLEKRNIKFGLSLR